MAERISKLYKGAESFHLNETIHALYKIEMGGDMAWTFATQPQELNEAVKFHCRTLIGRRNENSEIDLSELKPRDGDIARSPMGGLTINASYMLILGLSVVRGNFY
jgi:hypothetical protein